MQNNGKNMRLEKKIRESVYKTENYLINLCGLYATGVDQFMSFFKIYFVYLRGSYREQER